MKKKKAPPIKKVGPSFSFHLKQPFSLLFNLL